MYCLECFFFICIILSEILIVVIEHDLKENQRYRYMRNMGRRKDKRNFIDIYDFVNKIWS